MSHAYSSLDKNDILIIAFILCILMQPMKKLKLKLLVI